ncbi:MAG: hypothetical protein SFT92_00940 [Rickettsiales bacterium]|nr:hypothetical protein [Rickettsiales bacterium]
MNTPVVSGIADETNNVAQPSAAEAKAAPAVAAASPTQAPTVIDLSLFGELRTIQALRNSGIIPNDQIQSDLLIIKRINHGMYGDYSAGVSDQSRTAMQMLQTAFRRKLETDGAERTIKEGYINRLVDEYLSIMISESEDRIRKLDFAPLEKDNATPSAYNDRHKKEESRRDKYMMERDYYRNNPQIIQDAANKYQTLVQAGRFLPIGKIVALSGEVHQDPVYAADLVTDVLGVMGARGVKMLGKNFVDDEALARYKADPQANQVRIQALAENLNRATQPLRQLQDFEQESTQLDRILALKMLLSVQLHHALSQQRPVQGLIDVETKARDLVRKYTQVSMSLAYDYLGEGAAMGDARVQKIKANLEAEMKKDGIQILPMDQAVAAASIIARASAEDLLPVVQDNEKLLGKLQLIALSAGVDVKQKPLQPKPDLIGVDILEVLQNSVSKPGAFVSPGLTDFIRKILNAGAEAIPVIGGGGRAA